MTSNDIRQLVRYAVYLVVAIVAVWSITFGDGLGTRQFEYVTLIALVCIGVAVEDGN